MNNKTNSKSQESNARVLKYRKQFFGGMQLLSFPILMMLLLSPLEIYSGNIAEFAFGKNDFIYIFILVCVLLLVIGSAILSVLPPKIFNILSALLLAGSVVAYIQNLFMNQKIFDPDGKRIDWSTLKTDTIINLIIWIVLFGGVLALSLLLIKKQRIRIVTTIAMLLGLVQLVAIVSLFLTTPTKGFKEEPYTLSNKGQFELSPDHNIIITVLDSYSNEAFDEFLSTHPDTLNTLKDFTYYDDASSDYRTTFPSVIHMLTGTEFQSDITSADEWKAYCWQTDTCKLYYDTLKAHDYSCRLYLNKDNYAIIGLASNLLGKYDNVNDRNLAKMDRFLCFKLLTKMSLYKHTPLILKPFFEVMTYDFQEIFKYEFNTASICHENYDFYEKLTTERLSINSETRNSFVFTLLSGIHNPYTNDEYCLKLPPEQVDQVPVETVKEGIDVMINEYLNQLKELNIYDNATVIFCADHGGAQPIFIMKLPNESHTSMVRSSAPICFSDLWPTIFEIIGEDGNSIGRPIQSIAEDEIRERVMYSKADDGYYNKYTFTTREDLAPKYAGNVFEHVFVMK